MKYFGFAISDSMFEGDCEVSRKTLTAEKVREMLNTEEMAFCLNPSHEPTIKAAKEKYNLKINVPEVAPRCSLKSGDALVIMQVRGLPRLNAERHEYTEEEISSASFTFSIWEVK